MGHQGALGAPRGVGAIWGCRRGIRGVGVAGVYGG